MFFTKNILDDIYTQLDKTSELDLSNKGINDENAKVIAKALAENATCTSVNFRYNNISDEGTEAIVNALKINTTIIKFDIRNNKISNKGCESLKNLIKTNNRYHSFAFDAPEGGSFIYVRADPIITPRLQN